MDLEDLRIYQKANDIADKIWTIVSQWDYFSKDTVGKQIVRSAESIAANISEGYGRFHYKENRNFLYFSRGSAFETRHWIKRAYKRNLISESLYQQNYNELTYLIKGINAYIKTIGNNK